MRLEFRPTFPQHALQAAARNTSEFLSDWRTFLSQYSMNRVGNSFHPGSTAVSLRPGALTSAILWCPLCIWTLLGVNPKIDGPFDEAACAAERSFRPAI